MYSDDEHDDNDESHFMFRCKYSRPYLRSYEQQEEEASRAKREILFQIEQGQKDASELEAKQAFEGMYPVLRFFVSVEGFYTGSLDLTGRHLSRFHSLSNRWNSYLVDFMPVCVTARAFISDEKDWRGFPYLEHDFANEDLWTKFQKKWKVPPIFTFGLLLEHTERVLRTLSQNPVPKIQKLCLTDLPTELLDKVFRHAPLDKARILSSTCRQLREVARRHIFVTRDLTFSLPIDFWRNLDQVENPFQYMVQLARSSRRAVLSASEFLLGRPELVNRMRHLRIHDGWRSSQFEGTLVDEFSLSDMEDGFYDPISRAFIDVVSASRNLTSIALHHITLGLDIVRSISHLPSLHTLDLMLCPVQTDVIGALLSGSASQDLSWSVYNLQLFMDDVGVWYILLLLPNLRTLSARSFHALDMPAPPPNLWPLCKFYPTLERLWLENVDVLDLPFFSSWLQAGSVFNLQLTHFKLLTRSGTSDAGLGNLLASLQGMPLQVLVLDGIAQGGFILFDSVAEHFPSLIALTLIRRASNRQRRSKLATWPHASWEYALHLAPLQNLKHFGWNMDSVFIPSTSRGLLQFEEGFPADLPEWCSWAEEEELNYFGMDYWTALPFAAHCPSLQTYTVTERPNITCRISRPHGGRIVSELPKRPWQEWDTWNVERWNPSRFDGHWKAVLPESAERNTDGEGEY